MANLISFQDEAYCAIKQMILDFTLVPGEKISRNQLQEQLGISNTPVREATIRLQREDLFQIIPQSGTYVAKISLTKIEQAKFIRETIGILILAQAAAKLTNHDYKELHKILQLQAIYLNSNDYAPFFQLDDQFHQYFYQVTKNTFTWDWLQTISMPVNRFRYLRLKLMDLSWDAILQQHQALLTALEQGKTATAQEILRQHIHLMDQDLFQATHLFPRYFG